MRLFVLGAALLAPVAAGCGAAPATVKGRLVSDGAPVTVPAMQVSITLTALDGPSAGKTFSAPIGTDGAFEIVASGGELPPGNYQVSFFAAGKSGDKFKGLIGDKSPIRRELKPGPNELTLDIAKPQG